MWQPVMKSMAVHGQFILLNPATLNCCALRTATTTDKAMEEVFGAEYASLHVRVSNKGAIHLYTETLGYR
jgi:hypothetical protein